MCENYRMDVKSILKQLGSDTEAAAALRVHRTTIYRMREGKSPSFKTVQKLLDLQKQALAKRARK